MPPKSILKRNDGHRSQEGGIKDSNDEIVGSDLCRLSKPSELEREMMSEACATEETDKILTKPLNRRKGEDRKGSSPKGC